MIEGRSRAILDAYLAGGMPANIALMRLCMEAGSPEEVREVIEAAELCITAELGNGARGPVGLPATSDEGQRLPELKRLLDRHGSAWATIRNVLREAEHDRAHGAGEDPVARWGAVFDRLARRAPEAGVALYALGSPELLATATDEVVARMREWGLLGGSRDMIEIGCGIGRLSLALAPEMAIVVGLDVSGEMIAEARRRGKGVANASFRQTPGRDLSGIADQSIDLVLAADTFPYLVAAGQGLAGRHVEEAARVLRPGGVLLVLNYSYRGDADLDRRDFRQAAAAGGLAIEREGSQDFTLWDGTTFLARKP
jgi:SAM-dependent methyltransferase